MTTERGLSHPPQLQAIKAATKALIRAAGGQEAAEEITGKSQPRLSAYGLPNTGDFMPVNDVLTLEAITHGQPGHPHVTRFLAGASDHLLVPRLRIIAAGAWGQSLRALGKEFGQVAERVCEAIGDPQSPGEITPEEIRRHGLIRELDDLAEQVARMRAMALHVLDRESGR